MISLLLILSTSTATIVASAQQIEPPWSDGLVAHGVQIEPRESAGVKSLPAAPMLADSSLPDPAQLSLKVPVASLGFAGQQQGQPLPSAMHHASNKWRRNIVLGAIIAGGIIGVIVIATQRD